METRDLRYFVEVVAMGSVQAASERVLRTQPALTKCIRRLEAEIGGRLFYRKGRGIELTPLGDALFDHASMICRTVDNSIEEVRAVAQGLRGHIRLGVSPTVAHCMLPDVLEALVAEAPDLTYRVLTGTPTALRNALRTREVDLAIGPDEDGDAIEFTTTYIHDDDVVVAAGPKHPLAGRITSLAELSRFHWLLPTEDIPTRRWLMRRLREENIPINVQMEATSLINMRLSIIRGGFLTFIAKSDMRFGDIDLLREVICPQLLFRRRMVLLHMPDRPLNSAVERAIGVVGRLSVVHRERWSGH
jgi:DNA-binding transcriptional LysR family regulator